MLIKHWKSFVSSLKLTRAKTFYFLVFLIWGTFTFLSGFTFSISNPVNTKKIDLEEFKRNTPTKNKFCDRGSYYETYYSNSISRYSIPLTTLFYGQICDKVALFLLNLPYYYLLAIIAEILYKKAKNKIE